MVTAVRADAELRQLALAIARNSVGAGRPEDEILASEGISEKEYAAIRKNRQFLSYVDAYSHDLRENGFSFSAKSRVLAEDLLPTAYHMARDPDTPAAVRAKILENFVEWADLKPKKDAVVAPGAGFSITISLPAPVAGTTDVTPAKVVLEHTPAPPCAAQMVTFSEPDDYEYAGDDYL